MKKLPLFLLLIPNLVMAEIWTFSDASGFWSSPTSELTINSEDLLVNVQISCANFYKQPRLRINIYYEGYDWDEIKGKFTVVLKDNNAADILKKYEFLRTKLYFKAGSMKSSEDDDSEIINLIKAGNSIQINYTTFDARSDGKEINNELHSNWNTDLFKKEFTKLNATCK